ncbi:anti-sigma factor [Streptomyces sp. NPDC093252]|uniref:anti-sigma factor n=1 Tax=Streptomyces sp. NPDC093252 TaxID=3154980 RepID=UPI00343C47C0
MSPLGRPRRREAPHSLAAPYALDALDPGERRRYERHLDGCARCAAEVRALTEDTVRLAWTTTDPAPEALRARVLAAVRTTPQEPAPAHIPSLPSYVWGTRPDEQGTRSGPRGTRPPPERSRRPLLVPFATATAAAALVVAALFAAQAGRAQDQLDAERDRAREIAHVLAAPDARAAVGPYTGGRRIAVIASAGEGRAVVTLSGDGAPPGGRVHQLWLMRPDAPPRSLGLFSADTPLAASGLDPTASSLAVTIEPDGGSPHPTGQPIVQLALKSVGFGE